MWVGESREFDASSAVMGITTNLTWSTSGGYLSLTGSGFYRRVTVTQYFSGSATVECSWQYKLYSSDTYKTQRKTWNITCNDNPVSIYPTKLTLAPGEQYNLTYTHRFQNAYTNAANAYFSSDGGGGVISVTKDGLVTAHKEGTAYVNVYSKISHDDPYCVITVKNIDPTGVSIQESLILREGESTTLKATLYPSGATSSCTWISEDPKIATVSSSGTVNAIKVGSTRIKVTTSKGGFTDYCNITVKAPPIPPTSVSLPKQIMIYKGFSSVLKPVLEPTDAETSFSWSSENPSIVSVSSSGKITAKAVGQTEITVYTDNNRSDTCTVVVTEVPNNINSNNLLQRITLLYNLSQTTLKYIE